MTDASNTSYEQSKWMAPVLQRIKKLLPENHLAVLEHAEAAWNLLKNGMMHERKAALLALIFVHEESSSAFRDVALSVVQETLIDSETREIALTAISRLYSQSNDPTALAALDRCLTLSLSERESRTVKIVTSKVLGILPEGPAFAHYRQSQIAFREMIEHGDKLYSTLVAELSDLQKRTKNEQAKSEGPGPSIVDDISTKGPDKE